jgi:mannosyltransferase OCH1-like enzyme
VIPKIIHQTAYSNKEEWHPIWKICQQSTLKHFKDFEYKFWDDDSLDNFVKETYPKIYEEYKNFSCHIFQLDCVRYLLLHYYGGIYIDMDVYCYDNFYDELKEDIFLVESIGDELVQNSLMASVPNHPFWMDCYDLTLHRTKTIELKPNLNTFFKKEANENDGLIKFISGPLMLSDCLRQTKHSIYILPHKYFNHEPLTYKKEYKTKHMQSGMWGKEIKQNFYKVMSQDNSNVLLEEYHKYSYKMKTSIDLNNFDFYKDYSSI